MPRHQDPDHKFVGKMLHHWVVCLDHRDLISISEEAQLGVDSDKIDLGSIIKMHAAVIEFVSKKVDEFLRQHGETEEDYEQGLAFFFDCVDQCTSRLGDKRLTELLKDRAPGAADSSQGLIGVVEAARKLVAGDGTVADLRKPLEQLGLI